MKTMRFLVLVLVCLVGTRLEASEPSVQELLEAVDFLDLEILSEELVEVEGVPMDTLPWQVVRVRILDSVPATELVLVEGVSKWIPITFNKSFLANSLQELSSMLTRSKEVMWTDPEGVTRDLVKVLVDPSRRFGVLLRSIDGIPVADPLSDVYRDRKRQLGEAAAQEVIREEILRSVGELQLGLEFKGERISFYTWCFFGGEVVHWTLRFGKRPKISKKLVARKLGSWKLYY